ncbi:MAG: hypothetical protein LUQ23_03710, partial [Methanomicrobiales archaeon]|nr:hypothetical protein [Methanomicrobiales archaeon]
PVWHYTLDSLSTFPTMNRIYMSKIGDSTNPSAAAEGFIDNVVFSLVFPEETMRPGGQASTPVPQGPPGSPEAPAGAATQTATRAVPLSLLPALCAIGVSVLSAGLARRR